MRTTLAFSICLFCINCSSELPLAAGEESNQASTTEQTPPPIPSEKDDEEDDSRTINEPVMVGGTYLAHCAVIDDTEPDFTIIGCQHQSDHDDQGLQPVLLTSQKAAWEAHLIASHEGQWDAIYQIQREMIDQPELTSHFQREQPQQVTIMPLLDR